MLAAAPGTVTGPFLYPECTSGSTGMSGSWNARSVAWIDLSAICFDPTDPTASFPDVTARSPSYAVVTALFLICLVPTLFAGS